MTKWCEIFKTGEHTSSNGVTKVWTKEDLDKIVSNFNDKNPDVPICIGHPKGTAPAYGWVDKLKQDGEKLYCSFKQVQDEFKQAVNKGLFKTRSISLMPDLTLRHIAFLGAKAPAIKGMEQFCFENSDNDEIFECEDFEDVSDDINDNKEENFMEDEKKLTKALDDLNAAQKEVDALKFESTEKDAKIAELQKEIENEKTAQRKAEFSDFCEKAIEQGNILPAQKQIVEQILEACWHSENFCFSEADGSTVEKNAVEEFKNFVSSLNQFDFSETAKKKNVENNGYEIDFSDPKQIQQAIETEINKAEKEGRKLDLISAANKVMEGKK